ncbi:MAG: hypothetical protein ABWW65_02275 [Thermoprotei archaeon]
MIFRRRRVDPVRETLYALYHVKQGISRIEALMDRIMNRRKKLLEVAAKLEARGETFLAKKYAVEISKLDKIYARLADLRLVLEKISTSLEYALSLRNFKEVSENILEILNDVKKLPESTIPEIGLVIANLEHYLRNIEESSISMPEMASVFELPSDNETEKILSEAREIVKKRLEAELPSDNI